jgi:hypothetical protein
MAWSRVLAGITFIISPIKGKKYRAIFKDGTKIDFGARGYQHYHDKIGYYAKWNHGDKERRRRYRLRHGAIINKDGTRSVSVKKSAAYLSWYYLW